jgi:hypothetical protein
MLVYRDQNVTDRSSLKLDSTSETVTEPFLGRPEIPRCTRTQPRMAVHSENEVRFGALPLIQYDPSTVSGITQSG